MPFWRLYYHAAWATKNRASLVLDGMIEPITRAIEETARDQGVTVFAVGVMPDHVHVLAQIPPAVSVAAVVGRWKGASSHAANEFKPQSVPRLVWQSGYGVLSVSQSGFDQAKAYVLNQRERHARRELYGLLERSSDESSS
jgi:REP element-mobilizing transposase RayT